MWNFWGDGGLSIRNLEWRLGGDVWLRLLYGVLMVGVVGFDSVLAFEVVLKPFDEALGVGDAP